MVRNGNTNLFVVEYPSVRAGKTDLIGPIPGSASEISRLGIV